MARTDFVARWRGIASVDGLVETEDDLDGLPAVLPFLRGHTPHLAIKDVHYLTEQRQQRSGARTRLM